MKQRQIQLLLSSKLRMEPAPGSSYPNETLCLSPFHIVDHNKPGFAAIPSNDSWSSKGRGGSSWKVKLVKLSATSSLLAFLTAVPLKAHKVTSDYQLTPISLPGASGAVA